MKNKFVLTIVLILGLSIFSAMSVHSQILISILLGDKLNTGKVEFGLTGGLCHSKIFQDEYSKPLNAFFLGFYFDIKIKESWYLRTGVHVKGRLGASKMPFYSLGDPKMDSVFGSGHVNRKISYFNVPIEIKYRFKNRIFVEGGFQVGLRHKAFDDFVNTIVDKEDLIFTKDIRDDFSRIDAGVSGGLGYKFAKGLGMNLGARYYYGFVDIYKDDNIKGTNSALYVYVDIPIGTGKADKNKSSEKK